MINKLISQILPHMPEKLIWQFSKEYIAGKTTEQAFEASRELNRNNTLVTLDILGEFIENMDQAKENRDQYIDLINTMEATDVQGNYSIKPTMFGLLLDKQTCSDFMRDIVATAAGYDNFVRIDMENSPTVDDTIEIFRRIKAEFPKNVGLVLQAYLKRTRSDIEAMLDLKSDETDLNFRLCKGIYVESPAIAYKKYEEINAYYLEDLEFMFQNGIYPGIATHDKPLIEGALNLIKKYNIPKDRYEFQMLYGVTPKQRQSLADAGHKVRVYVPFGEHWFGYSTRRLKENPAMVTHIVKALFAKG
ncbi:MAG: proline dehydrogenase family protein [Desulfotignum sp.]|nr:proline dehydrogenase family protein [Desulfotignum sp.]MCF8086562.1 proline dehydrogenase family protein [Desulfotignum sp.]MCF8136168.1 proline dehydrogenase family protein [Desulfotignum sp.]